MGRYTSQTISNYNLNSPPDDGSETAANQVKYATTKTKLADPIKELAEAVDSELSSFDGRIYPSGVTSSATNLTLTKTTHDGKNVRVTGSSTITLPQASSATATFHVIITKAESANTVTIDTQGSETIDGASSVTLTENGEAIGVVTDGSNWFIDARYTGASQPLPRGYLAGFIMSNNGSDAAHDIDIAIGECRNSADGANLSLSSALTKQINAVWAEGTNQGGFPSGLNSGIAQASTWYHMFVILKTDDTVDAGFDTSLTAANLLTDATSYTEYRRIGSVLTDVSSNILAFTQTNDRFELDASINDTDVTNFGTTAVSYTLSVPTGITGMRALFMATLSKAAATPYCHFYSPNRSDEAVDTATGIVSMRCQTAGVEASSIYDIVTNTSGQVRGVASTDSCTLDLRSFGWIDPRGKDT